jgi:hypothetical protein
VAAAVSLPTDIPGSSWLKPEEKRKSAASEVPVNTAWSWWSLRVEGSQTATRRTSLRSAALRRTKRLRKEGLAPGERAADGLEKSFRPGQSDVALRTNLEGSRGLDVLETRTEAAADQRWNGSSRRSCPVPMCAWRSTRSLLRSRRDTRQRDEAAPSPLHGERIRRTSSRLEPLNLVGTRSTASPFLRQQSRDAVECVPSSSGGEGRGEG